MKRKLFLGLLLAAITLSFFGCSNNDATKEEEDPKPVITDAFFVYLTYDANTVMKFLPSTQSVTYEKLNTIDRYATPPKNDVPYYICIKCSDPNLDIKQMDEISIPDRGCVLNKNSQMTKKDSYFIWPVCYTTTEIPDSKLSSDGKYTFKYQLIDEKGNKSNVFDVTVNASSKK